MSKKLKIGGVSLLALTAFASLVAAATVVVTPGDTQGWSTADTRPGGAVNYVADATSPFGDAALQLTTNASTTAKAQYLHAAQGPISGVVELAYSTKQVSASFAGGDASYQFIVDLNGTTTTGGFTTFVYEPYQNGVVVPGVWQSWDVDAGQFWSSRSFSDGTCTVVAGAGGAPFYTLAAIQTACPNAEVLGYGVNIGTNNPSYDVYIDGVTFNGITSDFELVAPPPEAPTTKDECKDGGWETFAAGFKNQGDCVSSVTSSSGN